MNGFPCHGSHRIGGEEEAEGEGRGRGESWLGDARRSKKCATASYKTI